MHILLITGEESLLLTRQPQRIDPVHRIGGITIRVESAQQADGVLADIAAGMRVVIAIAVVMQATLIVEVLALKAQRVAHLLDTDLGFTEGAVASLPDDMTETVGKAQWGAEVVELVVVDLPVIDQQQRAEAVRLIQIPAIAAFTDFAQQAVTLPQEDGALAFDFANPAIVIVGVIAFFADQLTGFHPLADTVALLQRLFAIGLMHAIMP
ncbi:hypothetical protein WH50_14010 [Pokkaliibacter plantistimulans]|uniref:Uncharacterized protein n=1 Tax=Pokkaliibacter plantistimulans TaxID=1635171 RepID=A0ABX5LX19_9GAMM|nr:hypothetical protein WH50_14010 [Pokkaliibacter plantistimulans]